MNSAARAAMAQLLGVGIARARSLAGGDINDAFELELEDGRRVFAKTNRTAPPALFEAEARGLHWLAAAQVVRVPEVLGVSAGGAEHAPFLLLELLEPGPRVPDFDERLGRGLAGLHRAGGPYFGLDHDNFVGSLPQSNRRAMSWSEFYRECRLLPLLQRARRQGLLDALLEHSAERVLSRLEQLVGPSEPPARLHGDLWAGNLHVDGAGRPVLIDPAVYAGHREVDLAMMRLFGGFAARVFDAYAEEYPLAPGYRERVPLYQLYPLLVHVVLFGAGYLERARACLLRYT